ncbi:HIT family protein [Actimicrobium sp. CCC2.4]|uniref:HIT family protein n=1 Tax=Actimicrobium sp. CCC2.4 TaxID=3048606 RepID=UPI002AC8C590|nr:HIT family protein [Actimicrobium sp. CCC2.4]MEB0134394.1 HIT family protein [Actimicrobium sp. CCC2.4]WPX33031.1 HIT family protein [Actimicrobium sp. CCC2.4]
MTMPVSGCELCDADGGEVIVRTGQCRIVLVDDARYPGFCRVIWTAHAAELTDLSPVDRSGLMMTVCKVETVLREVMTPHKINLAALGNMVPHLHWHVIPRYRDDAHFPAPVWAEAARVPAPTSLAARLALLPALRLALQRAFSA